MGMKKLESVKNHLIKHKSKYIAGGTLLLGVGLGFYLGSKRSSREVVLIKNSGINECGVKIIGTFSEVDGEEFDSFSALRHAKKLIGSTSDDVGDVRLYYDNDGTTYAVAHNFEEYYGNKTV